MTQLEWSDALNLELPLMDETHREFVDLLAAVDRAEDAKLLPAWNTLVDHTEQHFGQEDAWMQSTRFASGNCHSMQHKVVLQVMREGLVRAQQGDLKVLRMMASELALWFPQHAQSMDAALALHLRRVGFDAATGVVHAPHALPGDWIHGCGGASCSDAATARLLLTSPGRRRWHELTPPCSGKGKSEQLHAVQREFDRVAPACISPRGR